jgi:hypothetical protein
VSKPARFWEIDVSEPLTPGLASILHDEVSIDFFGLSRPDESTVGRRIVRTEGDDVAVICVRRWPDHTGFSIEMLSSISEDVRTRYDEEQARVLEAVQMLSSDPTKTQLSAGRDLEKLPGGYDDMSDISTATPHRGISSAIHSLKISEIQERCRAALAELGQDFAHELASVEEAAAEAHVHLERLDVEGFYTSNPGDSLPVGRRLFGDEGLIAVIVGALVLVVVQYGLVRRSLDIALSVTLTGALAGGGLAAGALYQRAAVVERRPPWRSLSFITATIILSLVIAMTLILHPVNDGDLSRLLLVGSSTVSFLLATAGFYVSSGREPRVLRARERAAAQYALDESRWEAIKAIRTTEIRRIEVISQHVAIAERITSNYREEQSRYLREELTGTDITAEFSGWKLEDLPHPSWLSYAYDEMRADQGAHYAAGAKGRETVNEAQGSSTRR